MKCCHINRVQSCDTVCFECSDVMHSALRAQGGGVEAGSRKTSSMFWCRNTRRSYLASLKPQKAGKELATARGRSSGGLSDAEHVLWLSDI